MSESRTGLAESLRSIQTTLRRRLGRADLPAQMYRAVNASLDPERGVDHTTADTNPKFAPPTLTALLSALEPGATALDNALRVQRAEALSVTDDLTQLYSSRSLSQQFLQGEGFQIALTVSVGVATLPDVSISTDGLIHAADSAMYFVKDRGKNGIHVAG